MRRAFTLLELLVATALSAVLMVAVLHVLGAIGRDRRMLSEIPGPQVWRADLLDTLRRDLTGSIAERYADNAIVLTGQAALDPATLTPRDRPVTVTYRVVAIHGRNWLTRRQSARDGPGREGPSTELLCPDVIAFTVRPTVALPVGPDASGDQSEAQPLPASMFVRIEMKGAGPFEETLVLR